MREFGEQVPRCPFGQLEDLQRLSINCSSCPPHLQAKVGNCLISEAIRCPRNVKDMSDRFDLPEADERLRLQC